MRLLPTLGKSAPSRSWITNFGSLSMTHARSGALPDDTKDCVQNPRAVTISPEPSLALRFCACPEPAGCGGHPNLNAGVVRETRAAPTKPRFVRGFCFLAP